ncbi:class I SAM-dependent methyltransferase [Mycobacteroides saopaulense]|uniref:SAM-dependent methyltransferase n=1 Tax=Mycobacteroides saopaulense TaxID=1578165 RepID=A0ABX3BUE8_9MYCO|nr:class I SAM-dependent methyltransferase [Mycobacteroides saopaulense]OHT87689.1 SAM-dependent methyltransferase [Mycobacteroides saopaulense]OHU06033.1 SAM-dependent methyltransferase [Mycobacteroides saopaulense]
MRCRLCDSTQLLSVVDLGATPPCQKFLHAAELDLPEPTYPLHLRLCRDCMLLQIPALISPEENFTEYAYFSSYSDSWVDHARSYVTNSIARLELSPDRHEDFVVEVASNDGYLLQHVVAEGIRCLGIEPSVNVGQSARDKGVPTLTAFLDEDTAARVRAEHGPARLVAANNVYAHIPDLRGFTRALRGLVANDGWVSIEVHHALNLIELGQFDTIYHEHFQYYTVLAAQRALAVGDLEVVDVELLDTHGGSIRVWARPRECRPEIAPSVAEVLELERRAGLHELSGYERFRATTERIRLELLQFLLTSKARGKTVVGYGAPGKGNTLLNYCGIRTDLLAYTVDRNPYKQGMYSPGTRIPVHSPERIDEDKPDVVLVLPWNLETEITQQLRHIGEWGGKLVYPLPQLHVVEPHVEPEGASV